MRKMKLRAFSILVVYLLISSAVNAQSFIQSLEQQPNHWADSVVKRLNRKQRIAQLFFVRAHTDKGKAYEDSIARVIKREKIGGLVFFQGGPLRQAALTAKYQHLSKVPLLIAMDAEWGLGMRLDSTISYPYQMTLGAIQNNLLIEQLGVQIARELKLLGVHINFAPVVDINNNPKNPVIGFRSFGDNKYKVADKAVAYLQGMQQEGVLTSIKHFPGHGDTDVDSHFDLPQLPFSRNRLDSLELYPFKKLIAAGASGVMVAHMNIPSLDSTEHLPSTLSEPIVSGLLKKELGFKGLIFSDAMGMKGVVKYFPNGEADVRALIAGNDVLELSENSKRGIKLIRKAIRKHRLSWESINQRVKKVLVAKYWAGLQQPYKPDLQNLLAQLHRPEALALNQQLANESVTLLGSTEGLRSLSKTKKTLNVNIGSGAEEVFEYGLKNYFTNFASINIAKNATVKDLEQIEGSLNNVEQIILSIHDTRKRPGASLDFSSAVSSLIEKTGAKIQISAVFASPYTLGSLGQTLCKKSILLVYQNSSESQEAAVKIITGNLAPKGKLPVSVKPYFSNGEGLY
ncbi:MAG: glycoside hydrolase family 3 protein [Sphingobacteriaceae bacterium]